MNRIGQLLSRDTTMSQHDVEEVLAEQSATRRPFGQIALQWGMCGPQDLWRAWFEQLTHRTPTVQLHKIGVDTQAISHVPRSVAERYGLIPLRLFEGQLLLAINHAPGQALCDEIGGRLGRVVKFVVADETDIKDAQQLHYAA